MKKVKSETEQFCHDILNLQTNRKRPLVNLVMSLSAQNTAQSVVALSESELFHYHYSNLPKILSDMSKDKPNFDPLSHGLALYFINRYVLFCSTESSLGKVKIKHNTFSILSKKTQKY
jgi:hypothetical protein